MNWLPTAIHSAPEVTSRNDWNSLLDSVNLKLTVMPVASFELDDRPSSRAIVREPI